VVKTLIETNRRNGQRFIVFYFIYLLLIVIVSTTGILITRTTGDMGQAAVNLDTNELFRYILVITATMACKAIASAVSTYSLGLYSGQVGYKFRDSFVKHFLNLPYGVFEKKNSGEMMSVYTNDVPAAVEFVTSSSLGMTAEIVSVVVSIIFMLTINPVYTLIFYAMFPIFILLQAVISTPIQNLAIEMSKETARFNAVVNDSLQNTSIVVAYSLEDVMETRYLEAYDKYYTILKRYIITMLRLVISGVAATLIPIVFIMITAGLSVINNKMTIAGFITFTSLATNASNWLSMLSQRLQDIKVKSAGALRLNDNMTDDLEDVNMGEQVTLNNDFNIKFENVSFSYGGEGEVLTLDNVSFELKKGDRVAIVGKSGSGKSTILKVLLGLYQPQKGSITIAAHEIKSISKNSLRSCLAYVPQDSYLLPESISKNISGTDLAASNIERLEKACQDAGILSFIKSLPENFSSVLSEAAENVSGGQRQRLTIARAFYMNAPAILLDEATSALDPVTESEVLEILQTHSSSGIIIMVAHRKAAIAACNKIIVMDEGKVSGIGSHEELLESSLVYSSLYELYEREQSHNVKEVI